jgi:hypothetical protein
MINLTASSKGRKRIMKQSLNTNSSSIEQHGYITYPPVMTGMITKILLQNTKGRKKKRVTFDIETNNSIVLTPERIERAEEAEERLDNTLLHPSDEVLCRLLDGNAFLNCPLTSRDIKNLRSFRGPCKYYMVGKSTKEPAKKKSVSPPPPYVGQHTLHVDVIYVASKPMLLAVEGLFGYAHLIKLQSKHSPNLLKAMDEISGFYKNSYGKDVKVIRSDSEAAFKACKTQLNHQGIRLFLANPACHEGRVERFVLRVLRERVRAVMYTKNI